MRKSLTYKILAAVMAAGSLGLYAATPVAAADNFNAPEDGTIVNSTYDNVYGNGIPITITGGTIYGNVYGVGNVNYDKDASGGNVTINGNAEVTGNVLGGNSESSQAYDNTVNISGGSVRGEVYGGYSDVGNAYDNEIIISGSTDIENAKLYGYNDSASGTGNTLTIDGWKGNNGNGGYTVKSLNNFDSVNFDSLINLAQTTNFTVGSVYNVDAVNINSIGAGDYRSGTSKNIKLTLDNNKLDPNKITIIGDYDPNKYYTSERVNADGLFVNKYSQINVEKDANNTNTIKISAKVEKSALAGTFINARCCRRRLCSRQPNCNKRYYQHQRHNELGRHRFCRLQRKRQCNQ